jgi:biotin transport system substrate-specific component
LAGSALCGLLAIHFCGLIYLVGLSFFDSAGDLFVSLENLPELINRYSIAPLPGQMVLICVVSVIAFVLRRVLFY